MSEVPGSPKRKILEEYKDLPSITWNRGDAVRWWSRERWWYGVVLDQGDEWVTIQETAKGEDRPGGKIGQRKAHLLEPDPEPPLEGYYAAALEPYLVLCVRCGAMRSSTVDECFCHERHTKPAPPPRDKNGKLKPFLE